MSYIIYKIKYKKKIDLNNQDLEILQTKWEDIVSKAKPLNHGLATILQTSHPLSLENNILTIGLEYDFHKEQLENIKTREALLSIFEKILNKNIKLSFEIDDDYKHNHQNFKGKNENGVEEILDTFGGEML